jgi:hypothetical protein
MTILMMHHLVELNDDQNGTNDDRDFRDDELNDQQKERER